MTVKELIQALSEYPENANVEIFDEKYGYVDVTELFGVKKTSPLNGIVYQTVKIF